MGDGNRWRPFCIRDESAMALFLKMFVRSYSVTVPNFKFVSQGARFGQNFTPTTPTKKTDRQTNTGKRSNNCKRSGPQKVNEHIVMKLQSIVPVYHC